MSRCSLCLKHRTCPTSCDIMVYLPPKFRVYPLLTFDTDSNDCLCINHIIAIERAIAESPTIAVCLNHHHLHQRLHRRPPARPPAVLAPARAPPSGAARRDDGLGFLFEHMHRNESRPSSAVPSSSATPVVAQLPPTGHPPGRRRSPPSSPDLQRKKR